METFTHITVMEADSQTQKSCASVLPGRAFMRCLFLLGFGHFMLFYCL